MAAVALLAEERGMAKGEVSLEEATVMAAVGETMAAVARAAAA